MVEESKALVPVEQKKVLRWFVSRSTIYKQYKGDSSIL
jgi:hypothetical protein